jgi:sugar phosphate isomerase/epimerase
MPPDRGFVTNASREPTSAIDAAGRMGLDFVELFMAGEGDRDALADRADEVRERLDAAGVGCLVHLPFGGIDLGAPRGPVREGALEELAANLAVAGDLGARKAVVHPTSSADDPDRRRRLVVEGLRRLDDVAAEHGVELCAENMFGTYATVHDLPEVVAETDVSLTFDTGHARIEGHSAADSAAFLREHRDAVSHLHLNDTWGQSDDHMPLGAGTLDFDTLLDPLRDGWDGTLSLEIRTRNDDYIEHSLTHLDELI